MEEGIGSGTTATVAQLWQIHATLSHDLQRIVHQPTCTHAIHSDEMVSWVHTHKHVMTDQLSIRSLKTHYLIVHIERTLTFNLCTQLRCPQQQLLHASMISVNVRKESYSGMVWISELHTIAGIACLYCEGFLTLSNG